MPVKFEPSGWVPSVKNAINGETFHARCDIMSESCLMPMKIYESLNLWGLSKCKECVTLADNTIKLPRGIAEGEFTKLLGITISVDYCVIECAGAGQVTLGRSLLKFFGAIIDMNQGTMTLAPCRAVIIFSPRLRKRVRGLNKMMLMLLYLIILDASFLPS